MKRGPEFRKGFVKFQRFGPVEHIKQKNGGHAPEKRGIWAFLYPYDVEAYYTHRYEPIMPKKFRRGYDLDNMIFNSEEEEDQFYEDYWNEKDLWVKKNSSSHMKVSEFWYRGGLYSHFLPNGEIGQDSSTITWGEKNPDVTWTYQDSGLFYEMAMKSNPQAYEIVEYQDRDGKDCIDRVPYSHDYLEVFIPAGAGELRNRL